LIGRYFHDSQFSLKLTDALFNLDYIAANVGADVIHGEGEIFARETVTSDASGVITLKEEPIALGDASKKTYVYYRKSSENKEMNMVEYTSGKQVTIPGITAATEFCILYRKAIDGQKVTINSQFIPATLHAVLTVALYSGDACEAESATKAGELTIDIPRLQLSGANDITMSATGAAQTALEGTALVAGCSGCDSKGVYATITRFIENVHWYDEAMGLFAEDGDFTLSASAAVKTKDLVIYAQYANGAPKKIENSELTFVSGTTATATVDDTGKVTAVAAGTSVITFTYPKDGDAKISGTVTVTVTA